MTTTTVRLPVHGMRRRPGMPAAVDRTRLMCDRPEVHASHTFVNSPGSGVDHLCPGRTARHLFALLTTRPDLGAIGIVPTMLQLEVSCA